MKACSSTIRNCFLRRVSNGEHRFSLLLKSIVFTIFASIFGLNCDAIAATGYSNAIEKVSASGTTVTVKYSVDRQSSTHWIGLYRSEGGGYVSWIYTPQVTGQVDLTATGNGDYYAVLYADNGYSVLARTGNFSATSNSVERVSTSGSTITFKYSVQAQSSTHWIGLFKVGASSYAKWIYAPQTTGQVDLTAPENGDFYAVLYANNGNTEMARTGTFSVSSGGGSNTTGYSNSVEKISVSGAKVTLKYSVQRQSATHWAGLYKVGGSSYVSWNPTPQDTGQVDLTLDGTGDYYVILYADNGYSELARTGNFSVNSGGTAATPFITFRSATASQIIVDHSAIPAGYTVGLYRVGSALNSWISRAESPGTVATVFNNPGAGNFVAGILSDNSANPNGVAWTNPFTVSNAGSGGGSDGGGAKPPAVTCPIEIHVSPNGSSSNNGTADSPWTLQYGVTRALEQMSRPETACRTTITAAGGVYPIYEPIYLPWRGNNAAPLIIKAKAGETPIFAGGRSLSTGGWQQVNIDAVTGPVSVWKKQLTGEDLSVVSGVIQKWRAQGSAGSNAGKFLINVITVGNENVSWAHHPNHLAYSYPCAYDNTCGPNRKTNERLAIEGDFPQSKFLALANSGNMLLGFSANWTYNLGFVGGYLRYGDYAILPLRMPENGVGENRIIANPGSYKPEVSVAYNDVRFISTNSKTAEAFFDHDTLSVYYRSPVGIDPNNQPVTIALTKHIFVLDAAPGSSFPQGTEVDPIRNIEITGVTFTHTNYELENGPSGTDYTAWGQSNLGQRAGFVVYGDNVHRITLYGNRVWAAGGGFGFGVDPTNGQRGWIHRATDISIAHSDINGVAGSGILINAGHMVNFQPALYTQWYNPETGALKPNRPRGKIPDAEFLAATNQILSNKVRNTGLIKLDGHPIAIGRGITNTLILENIVEKAGSGGIVAGAGDHQQHPSIMVQIIGNTINGAMGALGDMGGLFISTNGTIVRNNKVIIARAQFASGLNDGPIKVYDPVARQTVVLPPKMAYTGSTEYSFPLDSVASFAGTTHTGVASLKYDLAGCYSILLNNSLDSMSIPDAGTTYHQGNGVNGQQSFACIRDTLRLHPLNPRPNSPIPNPSARKHANGEGLCCSLSQSECPPTWFATELERLRPPVVGYRKSPPEGGSFPCDVMQGTADSRNSKLSSPKNSKGIGKGKSRQKCQRKTKSCQRKATKKHRNSPAKSTQGRK